MARPLKSFMPNLFKILKLEAGKRAISTVQSTILRSLPSSTQEISEQVTFGLSVAFRVYSRRTGRLLRPEIFKNIWRNKKFALQDFLARQVRSNMLASLEKGGTLSGDLLFGRSSWAKWSSAYQRWRKYHPGIREKIGFYSGEMFEKLTTADLNEAVIIKFRGKGEGKVADDILIDFTTTGVGAKLAYFHSGTSKQPSRPFTFLTKRDMEKVHEALAETIRGFNEQIHAVFTGLRVGEVPTVGAGTSGVRRELRLLRLSKLGRR